MSEVREPDLTENEQVRQVLNEHPDLPVMLLTPSTPSYEGYSSYFHDGIEAYTNWILMPRKLERSTGYLWGLNDEKYYTDEGDAAEDVAQWLSDGWYDEAIAHGMSNEPLGMVKSPDDRLTEFCGYDRSYSIGDLAEYVAWKIVEDMPWQEYVVIKAAL